MFCNDPLEANALTLSISTLDYIVRRHGLCAVSICSRPVSVSTGGRILSTSISAEDPAESAQDAWRLRDRADR